MIFVRFHESSVQFLFVTTKKISFIYHVKFTIALMNRPLDIPSPAAYNMGVTMKTALPAVHNTAAVGLRDYLVKINRLRFGRR